MREITNINLSIEFMAQKEQLAVSYAAFVLSAQGAEVNADSINKVLKAANVTASAALVNAVAKSLKGRKVTDFFGGVGGGSGATEAPKEAPKKEEKKEAAKPGKKEAPPPPPEEDEGMEMGGLFD